MVSFDGREAVNGFRTMLLLNSLRLEIKIPGMRISAKVGKASTIVRREYGFKGKPPALLAQLEEWVKVNMPTVMTDQGAISTLHSNPAPISTSPIMAYVQPNGRLSETPVPPLHVRAFVPGKKTGQKFHVHLSTCPICALYGRGKEYGGNAKFTEHEVRSGQEMAKILNTHSDDIGYGKCIIDGPDAVCE